MGTPFVQWHAPHWQAGSAKQTSVSSSSDETEGVMPWYALQSGGWSNPAAQPKLTIASPPVRRALIVDSDRGAARDVAAVLKAMGLEPLLATCPSEADRYYSDLKPELMTLDIDLHGSSGLGLIRKVHALAQHKAKLLVISNQLPSQLAKARRAGAHAVLQKPIDSDSLRRAVRILLHS